MAEAQENTFWKVQSYLNKPISFKIFEVFTIFLKCSWHKNCLKWQFRTFKKEHWHNIFLPLMSTMKLFQQNMVKIYKIMVMWSWKTLRKALDRRLSFGDRRHQINLFPHFEGLICIAWNWLRRALLFIRLSASLPSRHRT